MNLGLGQEDFEFSMEFCSSKNQARDCSCIFYEVKARSNIACGSKNMVKLYKIAVSFEFTIALSK